MATKKPAPAPEAAAAPAGGKSKKRLIIMVLLGVLLIGLSIGGTIAALKFMGKGEEGKKEEMLGRLQITLGKTKEELHSIIAAL